ncbi:hypothetical protein [Cellulomonas sp. KRMCY2]|uniref:hypothetical protein n=1 Tax=Cellulomonas sp. KRMCY2 TaxID=1304865 RepID=UPI00045E63EE|nr:hypothetical protein [Cellulomonas sp. KRMCY2]
MNGRITTVLKPMSGRSIQEELSARLALLDGKSRFALLLWRLPDGVPFDLLDLDSGPGEYIQCAGGVAGRFTCEVRRLSADGSPRQEVIGRPTRDETSTVRTETIDWAENKTTVRQNEVLDFGEVCELFGSHLASGDIPASYETRLLSP